MLDMWKVCLQYFLKNLQTSQADISSFFYFSRIRIKKRNFQGIVFIWTQTHTEIFKSAWVYL